MYHSFNSMAYFYNQQNSIQLKQTFVIHQNTLQQLQNFITKYYNDNIKQNNNKKSSLMKNSQGINLSDLSEVQKKMCVKYLALNNIQFIQNENEYIATVKLESSQNKLHKNNINKISNNMNKKLQNYQDNKQNKKKYQEGSDLSPKKQSHKINYGKKKLFKSVKLQPIKQLEILCPEIQVYIFPKKIPFTQLQQLIQHTYEQYWQQTRSGLAQPLANIFYSIVCPSPGSSNKSKNDQNLLNVLQSIHRFEHKQNGIKIFYMFLSQIFSKQQLSYFLVLRALLQQFIGQKIIDIKIKTKHLNQNISQNSPYLYSKFKLKWYPSQKQLHQTICQHFLKIVITNINNVQNIFQKLTQIMYYCQIKKNNYIKYYDLLEFMIHQFDKQCYDASVSNLQLSYSNNGSTINDIFLSTQQKSQQQPPLQHQIQVTMVPKTQNQSLPIQQPQIIDNQSILYEITIKKIKQICKKFEFTQQIQTILIQKIKLCIQSIITMDKIKWVDAMNIQGKQQQLYYIQQTQIQYKNLCQNKIKLTMYNHFIKRIFSGPGFIQLFSSYIVF